MASRRFPSAVLAASALALAGLPTAASAQTGTEPLVCNEAQSSPRGVLDATASTDRVPPARHKDAAMAVGNQNGVGLAGAAVHSPALALCSAVPPPPPPPPPPPFGGGDGGGTV